jgi:hypothetical protein
MAIQPSAAGPTGAVAAARCYKVSMQRRNRNGGLRAALGVLAAGFAAAALVGCGSSSDQAATLLRDTFSGSHRVSSGELAVLLTVTPSGASGRKGPVTLSLTGPFQSLGPGKIPASAFNVSLDAVGTDAAVTITSTGSSGYVTFEGQSYKLPKSTFERLESTFVRIGSVSAGGAGSGALAKLGIQPERWLQNPEVVGDEAIEGTNTTRIRAGINMDALLNDLSTFLKRAASAGVAGASTLLPQATRARIATEVKNPVVDVWTGVADHTLRQLRLDLSVPVSGRLSLLFGRSAAINLTMQYADLNQPQTITAPTKLLPYGQFQDKLRVLLQDFEGGLSSSARGQ